MGISSFITFLSPSLENYWGGGGGLATALHNMASPSISISSTVSAVHGETGQEFARFCNIAEDS